MYIYICITQLLCPTDDGGQKRQRRDALSPSQIRQHLDMDDDTLTDPGDLEETRIKAAEELRLENTAKAKSNYDSELHNSHI